MPSVKCCIKNAAQSAYAIVKNKLIKKQNMLVAVGIRDERFSICQACDDAFDKETGRCKECGCFMKVKAFLSAMECPLDKWKKDN